MPTTARSWSSSRDVAPTYVAAERTPAVMWSMQVLDAGARRVQVHPGGRDALLVQRLARAVERRAAAGAGRDGARGRHAEALLVEAAVAVLVQVAGRLVRAGEPGADHHLRRAGRERQGDVARVADAAVGPHVLAQPARLGGALEHRGELRTADGGHHARGAHGAGSDADLDDVRARGDQVARALGGDHVARDDRHLRVERADGAERVEHLALVPVRGVDDEHVDARPRAARGPSA